MKRKIFIALSILIPCIFCSVYLYSYFAPPTNTPCTPIGYPDGNKLEVESTKIYTFETNEAYSDVINFYRESLKFDPPVRDNYGEITWQEYPIRDIGILFLCGSILDGYTSELGCIFVQEKDGLSMINIIWSYQVDGPATSCYVLPDIEPEDYLRTP
jgi:hypothetical protein